jgi:competence protein ComFC
MIYAAPVRRLRTAWHATLDTVWPHQCAVTGAPLERAAHGLAESARLTMSHSIDWPYCARCGATTGLHVVHDRKNPCPRCADRNLGVSTIIRCGTFDAPWSTLIMQMKFHGRWSHAQLLAPLLYQAITHAQTQRALPIDLLVPVPLHWRRRLRRGFNQAEELARAVAPLGGWGVTIALRRIRRTHQQSGLQAITPRRENLKNAFICRNPIGLAGKNICLVDDVCTTGATLHAATQAFRQMPKESRPASVIAAVICVTDHNSVPELIVTG